MNKVIHLLALFVMLSMLSMKGVYCQSLPTDLTLSAPEGLETSLRTTVQNYLFDFSSSGLKSSVKVERGGTANLRGMENKTVAILQISLHASFQGKEISADPIELKGAGSRQQDAEAKALRQLPRNAVFKKWITEVTEVIPAASDSSCAAITLLKDVSLPIDSREAANLVQYVSSFRQNKGCDTQAENLLSELSNQYADRQCETLSDLELEIAAATYNRHIVVQKLKRIRPDGPCWSRALGLAEKIGDDTRASLAARTDSKWIQWFVQEKKLY